jgi:hypothetical protein
MTIIGHPLLTRDVTLCPKLLLVLHRLAGARTCSSFSPAVIPDIRRCGPSRLIMSDRDVTMTFIDTGA